MEKIETLFAFLIVEDGKESVASIPTQFGQMPLIGNQRMVDDMRSHVLNVCKDMNPKLVTFKRAKVEELA